MKKNILLIHDPYRRTRADLIGDIIRYWKDWGVSEDRSQYEAMTDDELADEWAEHNPGWKARVLGKGLFRIR
jgi:hypothetical protein